MPNCIPRFDIEELRLTCRSCGQVTIIPIPQGGRSVDSVRCRRCGCSIDLTVGQRARWERMIQEREHAFHALYIETEYP